MMIPYNEINKKEAVLRIGTFSADLGGTEMFKPMEIAFNTEVANEVEKRIFVLTDGHAHDKDQFLKLID